MPLFPFSMPMGLSPNRYAMITFNRSEIMSSNANVPFKPGYYLPLDRTENLICRGDQGKRGGEAETVIKDLNRENFLLPSEIQRQQFEKHLALLEGDNYTQGFFTATSDIIAINACIQGKVQQTVEDITAPDPVFNDASAGGLPRSQRFIYLRDDGTIGGVTVCYNSYDDQMYISVTKFPENATSYLDTTVSVFLPESLANEALTTDAHKKSTLINNKQLFSSLKEAIGNESAYHITQQIMKKKLFARSFLAQDVDYPDGSVMPIALRSLSTSSTEPLTLTNAGVAPNTAIKITVTSFANMQQEIDLISAISQFLSTLNKIELTKVQTQALTIVRKIVDDNNITYDKKITTIEAWLESHADNFPRKACQPLQTQLSILKEVAQLNHSVQMILDSKEIGFANKRRMIEKICLANQTFLSEVPGLETRIMQDLNHYEMIALRLQISTVLNEDFGIRLQKQAINALLESHHDLISKNPLLRDIMQLGDENRLEVETLRQQIRKILESTYGLSWKEQTIQALMEDHSALFSKNPSFKQETYHLLENLKSAEIRKGLNKILALEEPAAVKAGRIQKHMQYHQAFLSKHEDFRKEILASEDKAVRQHIALLLNENTDPNLKIQTLQQLLETHEPLFSENTAFKQEITTSIEKLALESNILEGVKNLLSLPGLSLEEKALLFEGHINFYKDALFAYPQLEEKITQDFKERFRSTISPQSVATTSLENDQDSKNSGPESPKL
jgi:hypothetical protein